MLSVGAHHHRCTYFVVVGVGLPRLNERVNSPDLGICEVYAIEFAPVRLPRQYDGVFTVLCVPNPCHSLGLRDMHPDNEIIWARDCWEIHIFDGDLRSCDTPAYLILTGLSVIVQCLSNPKWRGDLQKDQQPNLRLI